MGRDFTRDQKFSNKTAELIDEEVKRIVEEARTRAMKILEANMDKLKALADKLFEKEVLDAEEVEKIIKGSEAVHSS